MGMPDMKNPEKWFNRIVNNLLYYQSNYFVSSLIIFVLVTIGNPHHMLYGILTMALIFGLLYYGSMNCDQIGDFKKDHPFVTMLGSFMLGYYLIMQLGCISVFLFGVLLPVMVTILHASLRLRNLKNKVANVADVLGVAKKTPMGLFLNEWGIEPDLKYIS